MSMGGLGVIQGWSMRSPRTSRGLSMDCAWTARGHFADLHGLSMESPWVCRPWAVRGQAMDCPW
eukprot:7062781-Lingulodinium_polyedra.AAC.1